MKKRRLYLIELERVLVAHSEWQIVPHGGPIKSRAKLRYLVDVCTFDQ